MHLFQLVAPHLTGHLAHGRSSVHVGLKEYVYNSNLASSVLIILRLLMLLFYFISRLHT